MAREPFEQGASGAYAARVFAASGGGRLAAAFPALRPQSFALTLTLSRRIARNQASVSSACLRPI